jgi:aryl-alcohol dehydrogenase-like predicted oxidoreductase
MSANWEKVPLGSTGLRSSPIGLGSSFGLSAKDVERAFDRGVNFFYWGSLRRAPFGEGLRNCAKKDRAGTIVAIQSYTRFGFFMKYGVDRALRKLALDYADLLILGWWNDVPPRRIVDAALALKEKGKVKHIMVSCHHRPTFEKYIADPTWAAFMVRYNAAHSGAEKEVFPHLTKRRPGVIAYTATRWGQLLDPRRTPPGEQTPRASDCYRFCLTNPNVDVVLAGPADSAQLDEAMATLDRGPMSPDELAWMKRIGVAVRGSPAKAAT